MPKLSLYKVGTNGRIKLGDLAQADDFYTVEKAEDGTITLSPVEVNTTGAERTTAADPGSVQG